MPSALPPSAPHRQVPSAHSPTYRRRKLGAVALAEALRRANVPPAQVEEVIVGNVLQAGLGQNPARQAATEGRTARQYRRGHDQQGLRLRPQAVMLAAQAIRRVTPS